MLQNNKHILFTGILIGSISCLYFLSLLFHLPLLVTILLILATGFAVYKWLLNDVKNSFTPPKISWVHLIVLLVALCNISYAMFELSKKHGEWDAWAVWNTDAKFLADPVNWRKLFVSNEASHPDYPLCLPSTIAFFTRLSPDNYSLVIPFTFSLLLGLCIPMLIYGELLNKNMIVAIVTLFIFADSDTYAVMASLQYADLPLSFFFLCAFVCMDHVTENKNYIILSSLFLGWCAWTKNEGAILALVFLLCYIPVFFAKKNIKYSAIGLLVPVALVIIFKLTSNAPNDMLKESSSGTFDFLFQADRYYVIYDSLMKLINTDFSFSKAGFYLYIILCIIEKKRPDRQMVILMICFVIYFMIYVVTPKPLPWHLKTSQSRLIYQLMPALIYVLGKRFSDIRFSLPALKLK